MLRLKMCGESENKIIYEYYPEDGEDCGRLSINKQSGKIELMQQADTDEYGSYKVHAVSTITKYYKQNNYLTNQIVAWC